MSNPKIKDRIVQNARNPKFLEGCTNPSMALAFVRAVVK